MADTAIKKRMARAKKYAAAKLGELGYCAVPFDNVHVCVIGFRSSEIRLVRIALDSITKDDVKRLASFPAPATCAREIWLRSSGCLSFEIHDLKDLSSIKTPGVPVPRTG